MIKGGGSGNSEASMGLVSNSAKGGLQNVWGEGGGIKSYPYKRGSEKVLAILKGEGGITSFWVVFMQ